MKISTTFDSGSIELAGMGPEGVIDLRLRADYSHDPSIENIALSIEFCNKYSSYQKRF